MKRFLSLFTIFLFAYALPAMEKKEDEIIYLNVGGFKIDTTRSTIELSGGEFLKTLISGKFAATKDKEGRIFIDRPEEEGKLVQYYSRTLSLPRNFDRNTALNAAKFFQIDSMEHYVHVHNVTKTYRFTSYLNKCDMCEYQTDKYYRFLEHLMSNHEVEILKTIDNTASNPFPTLIIYRNP